MGFDPGFECPTCLATMKSSDRTKQSVDDNTHTHTHIYLYIYIYRERNRYLKTISNDLSFNEYDFSGFIFVTKYLWILMLISSWIKVRCTLWIMNFSKTNMSPIARKMIGATKQKNSLIPTSTFSFSQNWFCLFHIYISVLIYIYIYIYVCVCVCVLTSSTRKRRSMLSSLTHTLTHTLIYIYIYR